ncbi:hypothetical protein C1H46_012896 [Malus baccata]|uniref:Pentatricopeptide repeat-containing protein n=1 Tax=Malus baccata TaxID=106549 RepID=A0A540MTI7_MALBA|nr:hypothetical protein C1H46_012896 [Malus baccata]
MKMENLQTNEVTFVPVLKACARGKLVKFGLELFRSMSNDFGVELIMEHYRCVVDLLGRAGLFWEAAEVIKSMPFEPDASVLGAILGSCKIHGTAELGNEVGKKLLELQPQHCGRYVVLSNINAGKERWDLAAAARKAMVDAGIRKIPAYKSGLMINAPFMPNVDSDMFVNNPNIMVHAMCALLGCENETKNAFAQFPQIFYDRLKDDPFGNQMVVLYGSYLWSIPPSDAKTEERNPSIGTGSGKLEMLMVLLGIQKNSPNQVVMPCKGRQNIETYVLKSIEAAHRVGDREYEYGTKKGGMEERINNRIYPHLAFQFITRVGSLLFAPDPPAFLGCVPTSGPSSMTQQKRWATGLLEILLSKNGPYWALYLQTSNLGYS